MRATRPRPPEATVEEAIAALPLAVDATIVGAARGPTAWTITWRRRDGRTASRAVTDARVAAVRARNTRGRR